MKFERENNLKARVQGFWNAASCGEDLLLPGTDLADYAIQAEVRYELEPYIPGFADFESVRGLSVLEIGVGLGADHQLFAEAGADLHGIDITPRAIEHTQRRLNARGLHSDLRVADAEHLPYPDDAFDVVYSWGVIHHSPDTPAAAREIMRVLRPGGRFAVMIYHWHSLVGYMLWLRYALLAGKPGRGLDEIYAMHLESPGTKAYRLAEARTMFEGATDLQTRVQLSHGDLLSSGAGQRHEGPLLHIARRVWPRRLLRRIATTHGLYLLISGKKPTA